jgi:hypothetical protein
MNDPTIVRTFSDRGEAEIARSLLEAEGVNALIAADDTGGNWPQFDLSAGVQLVVEAGDVERAREALGALAGDPQMLATEALRAMHCGAEAELALHDRELKLAAQKLRQAVRHWREVDSPVGEAETRLRLAECLLEDHDATGTELELHTVESKLASVAVAHHARLGALHDALREFHGAAAR